MPSFSFVDWLWLILAAFLVGLNKSGLSGLSLFPILILAHVFDFDPRLSTGVLLLQLIVADLAAVRLYHFHADWKQIRRVLPVALLGVIAGWWIVRILPVTAFRPALAGLILSLLGLQLLRSRLGAWVEQVESARSFGWVMGFLGGASTMMANAAGPVMSLYFLAARLPKLQLVGTSAWFFFVLNLIKVPFSTSLGLQPSWAYLLALQLLPIIWLGVWLGQKVVHALPQKLFERLLLWFAALGALKLIFP